MAAPTQAEEGALGCKAGTGMGAANFFGENTTLGTGIECWTGAAKSWPTDFGGAFGAGWVSCTYCPWQGTNPAGTGREAGRNANAGTDFTAAGVGPGGGTTLLHGAVEETKTGPATLVGGWFGLAFLRCFSSLMKSSRLQVQGPGVTTIPADSGKELGVLFVGTLVDPGVKSTEFMVQDFEKAPGVISLMKLWGQWQKTLNPKP